MIKIWLKVSGVMTRLLSPAVSLFGYARQYFSYIGFRIFFVFAFTLFSVASESVGFIMILPLLQLLTQTDVQPEIVQGGEKVADNINPTELIGLVFKKLGIGESAVLVLAAILMLFLIKAALGFGALSYNAALRAQLLKKIKGSLFEHYLGMEYSYFLRFNSGHFVNLINDQVSRVLIAYSNLVQFGVMVISAFTYIVFSMFIEFWVAMSILMSVPILAVAFSQLNAYVKTKSLRAANEMGNFSAIVVDALSSLDYITASGRGRYIKTKLQKSVNELTLLERQMGIAGAFINSIREPIAITLVFTVVLIQAIYQSEPVADIVLSLLLLYRGINCVLIAQVTLQKFNEYAGSLELLRFELANLLKFRERAGGEGLQTRPASIEFRDVYFKYDKSSNYSAKSVSFRLTENQVIALVGPSGSGKSTIARMATALLKPQKGKILINGQNSEKLHLQSWRDQIGFVSQNVTVTDETIIANVIFEDSETSKDKAHEREVDRLLSLVGLEGGLKGSERTLDWLQRSAKSLSAGEKQRLTIARELYKNPKVLILDEATSSLDIRNEQKIVELVKSLKAKMSVIMVVHRPAALECADLILVIEDGEISERGTFSALRSDPTSYVNHMMRKTS